MSETSNFPWLSFGIIYVLGLVGGLAVLPFLAELIRPNLKSSRLSLRQALGLQFLQTALVLGLTAYFGLHAAAAVGLAKSVTSQWQTEVSGVLSGLPPSIALAAITSLLVCVLDYYFLLPRLPHLQTASERILNLPLPSKLIAALYGGFTEEIIMRLGIFSLLVWAMQVLNGNYIQSTWILWIVNGLVSMLFAASHLPATAALAALTPLLVARTFLINGSVSLTLGYVYFTYGLEAAIVCHFVIDIILQIAGGATKRNDASS